MTAEVAVLNKHGVALAADSAVTISGPRGNKIYNAVTACPIHKLMTTAEITILTAPLVATATG